MLLSFWGISLGMTGLVLFYRVLGWCKGRMVLFNWGPGMGKDGMVLFYWGRGWGVRVGWDF